MRVTVTVVGATLMREDALVDCPESAPVAEILGHLRALAGVHGDATADVDGDMVTVVDGEPVDSTSAMRAMSAGLVRDGSVVSFAARPAPRPSRASATDPELRVVAGPVAGMAYPLRVGANVIGRGEVGITINDPAVSRRHATVVRSIDGVTVADHGSTNGTFLDGVRISGVVTPMQPGARLQIGGSTVVVATPGGPSHVRTMTQPRRFNRSPRLDPPELNAPAVEVVLPAAPHHAPKPRLPVVATVTPLIAGAALAAIMRRPEYLLFTVVSPLMIAGQWLADRSGGGRARRRERVAYEADLVRARGEIETALIAEVTRRNASAPNPANIDAIARSAHARLWERRPGDQDFLLLRLGSGDLPANVRITGASESIEPPIVREVPLTLTLSDVGVLGIVGPPSRTSGVVRALVGQLAALHSPHDLAVMLLAEPSRAHESDWLRWLPHARPASGFDCQLLVGLDPSTVSLRLGELLALIEARRAAGRTDRATVHRSMIVFIEGRHDQRAIGELLTHGPLVGVYAICIVDHASLLPAQCAAVATVANASSAEISLRTSAAPPFVGTLDAVSAQWIEHLARALAPLRDAAPRRGEALPDTVRWLDLAQISDDITPDVVARWRRPGSTRMQLGIGVDGIFELDLARDGPHALIAGTTGSGKSELLQTMVASLAFASRPDELTFVLIDYKGGAAFGACATLPHTVGIVTDLNGALAERALVSLGAELKRRELLLAGANASHLDAFRATGGHLARLVIVVDEFASLADELPDFVGGLVGIAQRGRSLGVHLVLATQRPEGVVSADIRANTNLRICLGVTRESESRDVIDTVDAARISRTTPGRGFARTGHGELHPFQAGRVGATAVGVAVDGGIHVQRSPFRSLAEPAMPTLGSRDVLGSATTDLDRIVLACRNAARQLEIETLPSPWLEPLGAFETPSRTSAARPFTAALGVHDVPLRQTQEPYLIDLDQVSHVMVAGSARSGRTTAVRTLVAELARSTSTDDLHVYVLDCGGGSLAALSALPHVGAVATMLEHERVVRLISMLDAELNRRQALFAAHGFGSVTEQRSSSADRLPHIVFAIDGWEPFCALFDDVDNGALVDAVWRLLRAGGAAGMHVVVTADRAGLVGRLASTVDHRLILRQADRADFSLIGLAPRLVPATLPPGRGYLASSLLETQVCLLSSDPSSASQLAALAEIASSTRLRDAAVQMHSRPRRIDPLPTHISLGEIPPTSQAGAGGPTSIVLGIGGDELRPIVVDLQALGPGFVVAGPPRSGRSSALATICAGLRTRGRHVIAVTPRPSMLAGYANECWPSSVSDLIAMTHDLPANCAVLVDDAELVMETPVAAVLDRLMRTARDNGHLLVIAGTTEELSIGFRGFIVDARRGRAGLVLCPRGPLDGELLGVRLPRGDRSPTPPGRGLLVVGGATVAFQVALPPPLPSRVAYPQTVMAIVPSDVLPALTDTVARPSTAPL